jgi:hypothetical protein
MPLTNVYARKFGGKGIDVTPMAMTMEIYGTFWVQPPNVLNQAGNLAATFVSV